MWKEEDKPVRKMRKRKALRKEKKRGRTRCKESDSGKEDGRKQR